MSRFYNLAVAALFFIGAVLGTAPSAANAQVPLTPEQAAELKSDVEGYLTNLPASLLLCSNSARGTDGNIRSCGGLEPQAGQLAEMNLVNWGAGDTVRCSFYARIGLETDAPACRIDRTNGITTYFYDYVGATGGGYRIANFRGDQFIDGESASGAQETIDEYGESALQTAQGLAEDALIGVAELILNISTFLLGLAGSLLNWVMLRAVFEFSLLIGNSPGLLAAWSIIRDLGNILLLFGFIFIGISTILGTSKFGDKKALPKLLIFAILMNFSLFAAEAVIDTANVLASTMYNQASIDTCDAIEGGPVNLEGGEADNAEECALEYGLAGHMIQSTGLAALYAANNPNVEAATMVGLAAFATIGAVVIFATSFMLITRAVVLTFLMITSPIGFAGMALPPLQQYAKQWWTKLIHQAFYAPILILMILISLKITDSFTSGLVGGRNLGAAIQEPTAASMGVLFVFALVIGFLVASMVAAKKFGAAGGDFAVNTAAGITGFAGRQTIGRGAMLGARAVRKSGFGRSEAGRRVATLLDKGGKSSFDVRASKGLRTVASKGGFALAAPSAAAAGGIAAAVAAKDKLRKDYAKSIQKTSKEEEAIEAAKKRNEVLAKEKETEKKNQEQIDQDFRQRERDQRENDENTILKPMRDRLSEKSKEMKRAREAGDKASLERLETQYNNDLRQYEIEEKASQERIRRIKDEQAEAKRSYDKIVESIDKQINEQNELIKETGNAGKVKYAEKLENSSFVPKPLREALSDRSRTAKAIKEGIKQTPKDKIFAALKEVESDDKKPSGGGSDKDNNKA